MNAAEIYNASLMKDVKKDPKITSDKERQENITPAELIEWGSSRVTRLLLSTLESNKERNKDSTINYALVGSSQEAMKSAAAVVIYGDLLNYISSLLKSVSAPTENTPE